MISCRVRPSRWCDLQNRYRDLVTAGALEPDAAQEKLIAELARTAYDTYVAK